MDEYFLYNDEEQTVSRNYLLFLDDRFSSKTLDETAHNSSMSNDGNGSSQLSELSASSNNASSRSSDKLIIKAKVYILEILEVSSFLIESNAS